MSDPLPRYLGPEEAADYVGLSPKTLQRMRVTGEGPPYVKARRRVIYDRFDLDEWAAKRKRRFTGETVEEPEPDEETDEEADEDPEAEEDSEPEEEPDEDPEAAGK